MLRTCHMLVGLVLLLASAACGDNETGADNTLDDFLPDLPDPTGETQSVFAGEIGSDNASELIPGPASSGIVGDFFMRNDKARFVIQAPTRLIGVVPTGGNLIDAVPLAEDGSDLAEDHFGETSVIYQLGRHCDHDSLEVVRDGSEGGVAVLRARGVTSYNDFVNIRGTGLLPIQNDLVPEFPDGAECATTYVLEPGATSLQVHFTIFNPGEDTIDGPMGLLSDTGGEVFVFQPDVGFARVDSVAGALEAATSSTPYMVWQGPDVAYGFIPRHEDAATPNSSIVILGVSLFVFDIPEFLNVLESDKNKFFSIGEKEGTSFQIDVFAGLDAADVDAEFRRLSNQESVAISGKVEWDDGSVADGARVGFFRDANDDGELDAGDKVVSFADIDADGNYQAELPAGSYLVRAEVLNQGRSQATTVDTSSGAATADLSVPAPVAFDFSVVDHESGNHIPARITVVGEHPVEPDLRIFGAFDDFQGIVTTLIAKRGTSTDVGDGADEQLFLPAGGKYRIFASHGTEWSIAEVVVEPQQGQAQTPLEFRLRRLVDTTEYIASEYHVHSIGSPDSPVPNERRVATAAADGVEFYATSDHDFVTDQQVHIEALGLQRQTRSIPGIEVSPLVYGHLNAWPIDHDESSPNGGAVDWPNAGDGFAMIPSEIYAAARERGAELIQVNHPRSGPLSNSDITEHFDRIGLTFDYMARAIFGDVSKMPVPLDWLRLPPEEMQLFADDFNALEVWNGFDAEDLNGDGVREITKLDTVMRDWFNFLSFGKVVVPIGSSDTHYEVLESMGMPRTLVRVGAGLDEPDAIESGTDLTRAVLDTLSGAQGRAIDVVVTDGPMMRVTVDGDETPLGKTITAQAGSVNIQISVQSPDWAHVDTIELFANDTPETGRVDVTTLQPFACFTSRTGLAENDPCALAGLGGEGTLTVNEVDLGDGFSRFEATISLDVTPDDIPVREGATGSDAWIVARVRGDRPIYPLFIGNLLSGANVSTFVDGSPEDIEAALEGQGRPATALTSPIFVDFDGGGYTAPFAP